MMSLPSFIPDLGHDRFLISLNDKNSARVWIYPTLLAPVDLRLKVPSQNLRSYGVDLPAYIMDGGNS
jgi:hypothetical protein